MRCWGVATACHSASEAAVRQEELFPASPISQHHPRSIPPSQRGPPASPVPAGGDSQVRCGRLVRLAPAEDGVSAALAHGSACFGTPTSSARAAGSRRCCRFSVLPGSGASRVSSPLLSPSPMQSEACGGGGRCGGGEAALIDGSAAAPRGWAGTEPLPAERPKGSAPAARRRLSRAAPGLTRCAAPRRGAAAFV